MDLYKPYYKLMKKLFKNAILIPDRFHIVIQIRNALDKTRINLIYVINLIQIIINLKNIENLS